MLRRFWDGLTLLITTLLIQGILVIVVGCGGGTQPLPTSTQPPSSDGWGAFPTVKELAASPAPDLDEHYIRVGGEYDRTLPNTMPSDYDLPALGLSTYNAVEKGECDLGYVMYRFTAADVIGEPVLHLGIDSAISLRQDGVDTGVYIGLANFTRGTWEWHAWPEDAQVALVNLADCTSAEGDVIVTVVCQSAYIELQWIRLGDRHWQFESLDVPELGSEVLIARLGHDGRIRLFGQGNGYGNGQYLITQTEDAWEVEPVNRDDMLTPNPYGLSWYANDFQLDNSDVPYLCGIVTWDWSLSSVVLAYRTELGYIEIGGPGEYKDNAPSGPFYQGVDRSFSMVFDEDNHLHLAYFTGDNATLRYGVLQGDGSWTSELVDGDGLTGETCALALDADGNPHISYNASLHYRHRYAYFTGSSWIIQTLTDYGASYGAGMAILSNDLRLLAYSFDGHLYLGVKSDSNYVSKTDYGFSDRNGGCQLFLRTNGTPVLYANGPTDGVFKLVEFSGLDWHQTWVQLPDDNTYNAYPFQRGCVADAHGDLHIFYVDENSHQTVHAFLP